MVIIRLAGGGLYDPNLNPNIKDHDDPCKDHDNPDIKDHNEHLQVQGTWESFWRLES